MNACSIAVIDPAVHTVERDCFNMLCKLSPIRLTYHLPALEGPESLPPTKDPLKGFIILGSATSVHDNTSWQKALIRWLEPVIEKGIPGLALCYGHQLIAHMFGGRVRYLSSGQTKRLKGFRNIHLQKTHLWKKSSGKVFVSHREEVFECPRNMVVVGKSGEIPIEALAHKTYPLWTLQAHPEATEQFLRNQNFPWNENPKDFAFGHGIVKGFLEYVGNSSNFD